MITDLTYEFVETLSKARYVKFNWEYHICDGSPTIRSTYFLNDSYLIRNKFYNFINFLNREFANANIHIRKCEVETVNMDTIYYDVLRFEYNIQHLSTDARIV